GVVAGRQRDGDAGAGTHDGDHARGRKGGRESGPAALADVQHRGLPVAEGALRPRHPPRCRLVGQVDRDVLDGHGTRRFRGEPVQHFRQAVFQIVDSHGATPPVISSASPGASRSRDSALAACAFTVPIDRPIACAVCASVMSAKYRSTTTARCLAGSRSSAAVSVARESTCANTSPYTRVSGSFSVAISPFHLRCRQRRNVFTMIFRTYSSGA